jgi:hypothetical protein
MKFFGNSDKDKETLDPKKKKSYDALMSLNKGIYSTVPFTAAALPDSNPDNPNILNQTLKSSISGFATGGILGGVLGAGAGLYKGVQDTQINQENKYNNIMQLLSNSQGIDKGSFVPKLALGGGPQKGSLVQAEKGEKIMTQEGDIYNVKAKELHKNMKKDVLTDFIDPGSYVFSDKLTIKKKDASKIVLAEIMPNYSDKYPQDYEKVTLDKFFSKEEHTMAELAEKIKKMYPLSVIDQDAFATQANNFNKESRLQALTALASFNELKKESKGLVNKGSEEELMEPSAEATAEQANPEQEQQEQNPEQMAWGGGNPYAYEKTNADETLEAPLKNPFEDLSKLLNLNPNNPINSLMSNKNNDGINYSSLQNTGNSNRTTVANPMNTVMPQTLAQAPAYNPYSVNNENSSANNTANNSSTSNKDNSTILPPSNYQTFTNNSDINSLVALGVNKGITGDVDPNATIPAWGMSLTERKKKLEDLAAEKAKIGQKSFNEGNKYLGFGTMSAILGNLFQNPQSSAPQYDQRFIDASPQEIPQSTIDYAQYQSNKGVQPIVQGAFENTGNFAEAMGSLSGIPAKIVDAQSKIASDIATQNNTLRQAYLDKKSNINEKQVVANNTALNTTRENSNYITAQIAGVGTNYFNQKASLLKDYRDYTVKAKDDAIKEMDNANLIAWLTGKKITKPGETTEASGNKSLEGDTYPISNKEIPLNSKDITTKSNSTSAEIPTENSNTNSKEEKTSGKDPYRRDPEATSESDKTAPIELEKIEEPIELEKMTPEDEAKSKASGSTTSPVTPGTEGEQPLQGDTYPSPGEEISRPLPVAPKDITQQPSQEKAKEPAKSTDPIDNKYPVVEKGKENTSSSKKEGESKKDYKGEKREVEDPETGRKSTKVVKRQYKDEDGVHIEYEDGSSEKRYDVKRKSATEREYSIIEKRNSRGEIEGIHSFKPITDKKLLDQGIVEEKITEDKYGTIRKEYVDKNRKVVGKSTIVKSGALTPQEYEPNKVVKEDDKNKVVDKKINERGQLVVLRRNGSYEIVSKLRKNKYQVTVYDSRGRKVKTVVVKNKK